MADPTQHDILLESGTNELEVLVFHIDDQRYGVNVAKVREVIKPLDITSLPHTHAAVLGVFQLRSTVIPAINLKRCLGKEPSVQPESKIIIMEFNDTRMGFLVDSVEQIYRVSWQDVAPMPDVEGVSESSLTSIAHIGDNIILMLDFEKLVFDIGWVDLFERNARNIVGNVARNDRRLLLAEDSHVMRTLIKGNLVKAGYSNVTVCADGQEAWDTLQQSVIQDGECPFDLVITDIEMPRIDGLHLTRRIREHPGLKGLPIVIFSSLVSVDNEKKCEAVGADAQITKPQLDKLVELVDGLIAKSARKTPAPASTPA